MSTLEGGGGCSESMASCLSFLGVSVPGECQWLHLELIKEMRSFCETLFPAVEYAYSTIPTYPSGQIGFMLCSKNPVSVSHPTAVAHSSVAAAPERRRLTDSVCVAIVATHYTFAFC